jgi:hypothetical protein
MRILVLKLMYPPIPIYHNFSMLLDKDYCSKHGYDFEIGEISSIIQHLPEVPATQVHGFWKKVQLLRKFSTENYYDVVAYLDLDAWFYNPENKIEDLVKKYMKTTVMFGPDLGGVGDWTEKINAGVVFFRPGNIAKAIFTEWWNVPFYDPQHLTQWPADQAAFNAHILKRWRKHITIAPHEEINDPEGENIRHLFGMSDEYREAQMRAACVQRSLL